MLQQHRAVGLQTDCMVAVPAPVVRLPDSHVYALWPLGYGLPPCNNNNTCSTSLSASQQYWLSNRRHETVHITIAQSPNDKFIRYRSV